MKSTIICVDDDKWVLTALTDLLNDSLGDNYIIEKALSGKETLEIIEACLADSVDISLVISDYIMPGMKGDELLEQVKLKTPMTRRIMLTGFAAVEGITNAINKAGIYRFISKPWDNKDMMLTVLHAIRSYEQDKHAEKLANSHKELYHKFQSMATGLQTNLNQTIGALSAAIEVREGGGYTGHSERVAEYSTLIANSIKMSDDDINSLKVSALLHDIGKLGLKDNELESTRGLLCYKHNSIVKRQAELAREILAHMDYKFLPGIVYHMERYDGLGPHGLSASTIPLNARIIGLCNYFDILATARQSDATPDVLGEMAPDKNKIFDSFLFDTLMKALS